MSFDEHKFIKSLYECEQYKYLLEERQKNIENTITSELASILISVDNEYLDAEKRLTREKDSIDYEKSNFSEDNLQKLLKTVPIYNNDFAHWNEEREKYNNKWWVIIASLFWGLLAFYVTYSIIEKLGFEESFWMFAVGGLAFCIRYIIGKPNEISKLETHRREKEKFDSAKIIENENLIIREEYIQKCDAELESRKENLKRQIEDEKEKLKKQKENQKSMMITKYNNGKERISLENEKEYIRQDLDYVNRTLDSLYNKRESGVLCLHPNYRGLVTVSVIYGYFDTGRVNSLKGADGAYNLYEDEKFKGRVVERLFSISNNLSSLNGSMYYVGLTLNKMNNQLSTLNRTANYISSQVDSLNYTAQDINSNFEKINQNSEEIKQTSANIAYYEKMNAQINAINVMHSNNIDKFTFNSELRKFDSSTLNA